MMRIKVTSYRDAGEESASRYGSVKATYLSLLLFDLVALALLVLSLLVDAFTVFLSAFLLLALFAFGSVFSFLVFRSLVSLLFSFTFLALDSFVDLESLDLVSFAFVSLVLVSFDLVSAFALVFASGFAVAVVFLLSFSTFSLLVSFVAVFFTVLGFFSCGSHIFNSFTFKKVSN